MAADGEHRESEEARDSEKLRESAEPRKGQEARESEEARNGEEAREGVEPRERGARPKRGSRPGGHRAHGARAGHAADAEDDISAVLTGVGARLRALRQERGTTLAQIAETTGISLSTLSRLESGGRRPTLELLLPLAKVYGVQLDELVGAPATGDPRVHFRPFTRDGMTFVPLTRHLGGLHAYKQILPGNRGATGPLEQRVHEGYEWVYVLAGRLRLVLGEHDLVLAAGEAAEFDTRTPHAWAGAGPEPVEFLSLFGKQGERMHVRARPSGRKEP